MRIRFTTTRPPARMLELQLAANLVRKDDLFLQITAAIKNTGTARQPLQQEGTRCQVLAVKRDLTETSLRVFPVFLLREGVDPHETLGDLKLCKIPTPPEDLVWVRVNLRAVSAGTEWNSSLVLPLESLTRDATGLTPSAAVAHGPIPERRDLTLQVERLKKEQTETDRRVLAPLRPRREVSVVRPATAIREVAAAITDVE